LKRRRMNGWISMIALLSPALALFSQTTETFESFALNATSFTSGGVLFTMTPSGFIVDVLAGYGFNSSNKFIDNYSVIPNPCQIKSASPFTVKSLYLYPSADANGNTNQTAGVNVTFAGKLSGTTRFTYSPPSSDFAAASYTDPVNRGFSLVNFATPGYDNTIIDELVITLGGSTVYFAYDNFTWASATLPAVTFTDGSGFMSHVEPGFADQVLGRFRLTGDASGASLTASTIRVNGVRSGLSNLKLWSSADAAFSAGSDTQLGSAVGSDPGDGGSASFSGFSAPVGTGGTYFFLTADAAAGASGTVEGVIVQNSSLTLFAGTLSGSISNAPLSLRDVSLSVGLSSFSASQAGGAIVLRWVTESETDNAGFILERSEADAAWIEIASFRTDDALMGRGNRSDRTEYACIDENVRPGIEYRYRLSDVNTRGAVTVHAPISIQPSAPPENTVMDKAFPNPFNPRTYIAYRLAENTAVSVDVFDLLGRRVRTLFDGRQAAGSYHVYWNGATETGAQTPGGVYFVCMRAGMTTQVQKVVYVK
jgi:hypothetical protein